MKTKDKFSVGRMAMEGGFWTSCLDWTRRLGSISLGIILARLLQPEDLGLLAIAMVVTSAFTLLAQPGISAAIIQRKSVDSRDLDLAWTIENLILSSLTGLVLLLAAPWVGTVFEDPRFPGVIRALAVIPLLRPFETMAVLVLIRDLHWKKRFQLQGLTTVSHLLTAITLAFLLRSVWALVWASIVEQVVRVVLSYLYHPRIPRICLERKRFSTLFTYGKWVMGMRILKVFKLEFDKLLLGKLGGMTSLGFYQVGTKFSRQLTDEVQSIMLRVFFPIYSRIQEDKSKVRKVASMLLELIFLVMVPMCTGLIVVSEPLILAVFGDRWAASIPVLRIMAVAGLIETVVRSTDPLFRGKGLPHYEVITFSLFLTTLIPLGLIWTKQHGYTGMCWAVLVAFLAQTPGWAWCLRKAVSISLGDVLATAWYPAASAAFMAFITYEVGDATLGFHPWIQLAAMIPIGVAVYCAMILMRWRLVGWEVLDTLWGHLAGSAPKRWRKNLRERF